MTKDNPDKLTHFVPGQGWRYDTEHRGTRLMYGHDYSNYGTYLITMVTKGRQPLFGTLRGTTLGGGLAPYLDPSPLGRQILEQEIPAISQHYPLVEVWDRCLMPDHLHMIVRVKSQLPEGKNLGSIIAGFKGGCSQAWWALLGLTTAATNATTTATTPAANAAGTGAMVPNTGASASTAGRQAPMPGRSLPGMSTAAPSAATAGHAPAPTAAVPATSQAPRPSLFEKGYNNRILMEDGQLGHWKGYIAENAFRKVYRQEHPQFMERALEVHINGVRYGAFGNLFLLQYPERHQVFFHRRMWEGDHWLPTEETAYWQQEHNRLISLAEQGDVLVTPGISECEKRIKNEALQRHLPLIHIQDTPIRPYWKPEESRYYACAEGTLLILAPWEEDTQPWRSSQWALFHHLNELAAVICSPEGVRTLRR